MNSQVSTDPVADMLTRIRNGIAVDKSEISLPHSNLKEAVAKLLVENNFIEGLRVEKDEKAKVLVLVLNRDNGAFKITEISKISKPGRRAYVNAKEIPVIKQGRGLVILSTSKGVMTGQQAKVERVGGELICQVY